MTTPVPPGSRPDSPTPDSMAGPSSGASFEKNKQIDPTGAWTQFFQRLNPGQPVTPDEIKRFQMGMLRWFSLLIAQENRIWKASQEKMKRSMKGE